MGFLSTGMIIGLEEGFRTKQEEIADRQNQLTKDYRNEVKASIIKANDTIRTDRKKDDDAIRVSQGIISAISEDLPGLANKLKGLDQDTLIELGNSYLPNVRIQGDNIRTYKDLGNSLEKTNGTVLSRDKQIRETKAKAAEMKTVEQQTQESFLDMFSPTKQGQIERDRINRGVTEEQREVMGRKGASKERRIIEGVAPQVKDRLNPSLQARIIKDNDAGILDIPTDTLPSKYAKNARGVARQLVDLSDGDISERDARLIPSYIESLVDRGIEFNQENSDRIEADIQERGTDAVLSEMKAGKYKIPDAKPKPEQTDTLKKDDPPPIESKLDLKKLRKTNEEKKGDFFIRTYVDDDTGKVYEVTLNKLFKVVDEKEKN